MIQHAELLLSNRDRYETNYKSTIKTQNQKPTLRTRKLLRINEK